MLMERHKPIGFYRYPALTILRAQTLRFMPSLSPWSQMRWHRKPLAFLQLTSAIEL